MIILPAIDIKDGNCVRLVKGDFDTVHKVAENPLETARSFERDGAEWLHMVDLDGAKDAVPKNRPVFLEIAARTRLKVEVGGGIRDLETVEYYLSHDLARAMTEVGVQTIIYTDISKDGTLTGPNLDQLSQINEAAGCNIIASGGISSVEDIHALKKLGLYGAICGKSIYQGTLSLKEALAVAKE